jgi:hypothetical protein
MTNANSQKALFASVNGKRTETDFTGGRISSDGGSLLLRQVDSKIGLTDSLAKVIPDRRDQSRIRHSLCELLAQRIYGLALGYEDLNDHDSLRDDPGLQTSVGRDPGREEALGSSPTLCRLENGIDRKTLWKLSEVMVDTFIESYDSPPERLVLDFDATDDPLHGKQESSFFHGYYYHYCYLPLYVFCGEKPLVAYLRPSNIDASLHSRAILKMLAGKLREAWPEVKIIIRGDSGFCRWKLMKWCESHGVKYCFGYSNNPRVKRLAKPWIEFSEALFNLTGNKQRRFGQFHYAAGSWSRKRRTIVKAEHLEKGRNTRFIVTSLKGDPQELYDNFYCARGEMENRIKEKQLGLFADRTSCHRFLANQFRLLLSTAAYILIERLRALGLKGTELGRAQADTIRTKLFKIGARILSSTRRIVFKLASGYPLKEIYYQVVSNLGGRTLPASGYG